MSSILFEFREILHQLWGKWQDGTPYNGEIKEGMAKLDSLGRKLEELSRK